MWGNRASAISLRDRQPPPARFTSGYAVEGAPSASCRTSFASSRVEKLLTSEVAHHRHDSAVAFPVVRRKVKLQKDIGHVFLDRAH